MLSPEQIESYERDGFVVVHDFVSAGDRARLRDRALEIVDAWEPSEQRSVFTTNEQERVSDGEFLASGSTTWCFFEEDAFGPDGELTQPKELSINKIGHAQHDLDDEFERFAYQPRLAEIAADIGLVDARCTAVDVHLQAAAHRRRGRLPPGRHVPVHRPDERHRLLVRHRGRDRSRTGVCGQRPVATGGRCASCSSATRTGDGTAM